MLYADANDNIRTAFGDDDWYHTLANLLADGSGYVKPFKLNPDFGFIANPASHNPTAWHPPLFPLILAGASKLGLDSFWQHQLVGCFLGALSVFFIGLAGRRLGGNPLGLLAALAAAIYAPLIMSDSVLMSESAYVTAISLTMWLSLRANKTSSWQALAAAGIACGLAILARGDAILLLPLLALALARCAGSWQLKRTAIVLLAATITIAPWVIRNWVTFGKPTISHSYALALTGANCDSAYYGKDTGFYLDRCATDRDPLGGGLIADIEGARDEAKQTDQWINDGLDYMQDHWQRFPKVAAMRVLRTWQIYNPVEQENLYVFLWSHISWVGKVAVVSYFIVLAFALVGIVGLIRRRSSQLLVLLAPLLFVTILSISTYGAIRLRVGAEPALILLASWGFFYLAARISPAGRPVKSLETDRRALDQVIT